jgi:hypothetical protein
MCSYDFVLACHKNSLMQLADSCKWHIPIPYMLKTGSLLHMLGRIKYFRKRTEEFYYSKFRFLCNSR